LPPDQIAKGFCFVHFPKTVGTSILSALGVARAPYTHCPAWVLHDLMAKSAQRLRFLTVVRDPYARFASSSIYIT